MTCIAALVGRDFAVMGADRQIVDGWIGHESGSPKVVRWGPWLLGTTGPTRVNNAVKYQFDPPHPPYQITEKWIVTAFVPALSDALDKTKAVIEGWIGGKESEQQGTILCAAPGALFTIQADFAVDLWNGLYASIGTGQRYALSAMFAAATFLNTGELIPAKSVVRLGVEAAKTFDIYCGGDVDILSVGGLT